MGKSRAKPARQAKLSAEDALRQSLNQAVILQKKGNLKAAERKYRSILKKAPDHSETLQYLAILLQQLGHSDSALHFMQKALTTAPENPHLLKNIAEIYRSQDDFGNAHLFAEKALSFEADNVDALVILGSLYNQQGQPQEAIRYLTRALELNPDDVFARYDLAGVLGSTGQRKTAIEHYRRALSQHPDFDECRINLANTLLELEYFDQAVDHYQQVLVRQPGNASVLNCLGKLFEMQGNSDKATLHFELALKHDPNLVDARLNLGKIFIDTDPEQAQRWFSSALEINPENAQCLYWLGVLAQTLGKFEAATVSFEQSLGLKPDFSDAWYRLSIDRSHQPTNQQLETIEQQFNHRIEGDPDDKNLIALGFALGRFHEQRADYTSAFEYFHYANRLKAQRHHFDSAQHDAQINDIINSFDADFFRQRQNWGSPSKLPVFIVGMPRSGTTLVEQIVSSHDLSFGAGELRFMQELVASLKISNPAPSKSHAGRFKNLDQQQIGQMAQQYLTSLQALRPDATRILDKLPGNYLRLGVILTLFPQARIIHCKREPMDTCWSCYAQNFERGLNFTSDLESIGHAYRGYLRLMAHWQEIFPANILDLEYEALLDDPETQSRRLLEHCGLEWDPEVLNFADQRRPVSTASLWQVRQPLYKTAIGRWKLYQQHLKPLQKILSDKN
jgi:tetratricopeptide (TPR) repeat protein